MYVLHKVKFKPENDNDKVTHKTEKMEVASETNRTRRGFHKHRNMKNCYCCGSGTHMLNHCYIRDTITRYH